MSDAAYEGHFPLRSDLCLSDLSAPGAAFRAMTRKGLQGLVVKKSIGNWLVVWNIGLVSLVWGNDG